jgi:hypothetical protein
MWYYLSNSIFLAIYPLIKPVEFMLIPSFFLLFLTTFWKFQACHLLKWQLLSLEEVLLWQLKSASKVVRRKQLAATLTFNTK